MARFEEERDWNQPPAPVAPPLRRPAPPSRRPPTAAVRRPTAHPVAQAMAQAAPAFVMGKDGKPLPADQIGVSEYKSPTGETVYSDERAFVDALTDDAQVLTPEQSGLPGAAYGMDLSDGRDN